MFSFCSRSVSVRQKRRIARNASDGSPSMWASKVYRSMSSLGLFRTRRPQELLGEGSEDAVQLGEVCCMGLQIHICEALLSQK